MLFNSYEFLFIFLPFTIFIFYQLGEVKNKSALVWLVLCSLFFYGCWNPVYLVLLSVSIFANYIFAQLFRLPYFDTRDSSRKFLLFFAVVCNLALLFYYKYFNFVVSNVAHLSGREIKLDDIILPLGISFFTFTQMTFLIDVYLKKVKDFKLSNYFLFVTYFPHLIAGPLLHHKEMMGQFSNKENYNFKAINMYIGLTVFFIGLFKKVVLADNIAPYVWPVFDVESHGYMPTFFEAWGATLAYTLQIYFDFSGYSDMAIGLSRMFGINLPLNFSSPYKSQSIIEFWRRWHITLSRFLREYIYIPLGGSKNGQVNQYKNLIITMLIGGAWHGAGWTFIIWGALHGLFLAINHGWHTIKVQLKGMMYIPAILRKVLAHTITMLSIMICWVFFRASSLESANAILSGMVGINGFVLPSFSVEGLTELGWIIGLFLIVFLFPNTQEVMRKFPSALDATEEYVSKHFSWLVWKPNLKWAVVMASMAIISIWGISRNVSEFIYFQF